MPAFARTSARRRRAARAARRVGARRVARRPTTRSSSGPDRAAVIRSYSTQRRMPTTSPIAFGEKHRFVRRDELREKQLAGALFGVGPQAAVERSVARTRGAARAAARRSRRDRPSRRGAHRERCASRHAAAEEILVRPAARLRVRRGRTARCRCARSSCARRAPRAPARTRRRTSRRRPRARVRCDARCAAGRARPRSRWSASSPRVLVGDLQRAAFVEPHDDVVDVHAAGALLERRVGRAANELARDRRDRRRAHPRTRARSCR